MFIKYKHENVERARKLRKNATEEENHLWYDFLRNHRCRFQRQKTIGSFIADFYCYEAKLVIEIDGRQHYTNEGKEYDQFRTEFLEEYGLTVIRFTNDQVNKNFKGVCSYIDQYLNSSEMSVFYG